MIRPLSVFALILCVIPCSNSQAQSTTYQFIDGAVGDQAGHTLSGTIILDPACGSACTAFDFWEYTISGPQLNRSASSNQYGPPLFSNNYGLFTATPTELIVDFGGVNPEELTLDFAGLAFHVTTPQLGMPLLRYSAYDFDGAGGVAWDTTPLSNAFTIARVVPEPSFSLLLTCMLPWFLCRSRRQCQR